MNPSETQDPTAQTSGQLTPDQLSATLAHATNLQESMMPQAPQEQPQEAQQTEDTPPEAPESTETQDKPKDESKAEDAKLTEMEGKMSQGFEDLRNEMHATVKDAIGSLKKDIEDALNSEN